MSSHYKRPFKKGSHVSHTILWLPKITSLIHVQNPFNFPTKLMLLKSFSVTEIMGILEIEYHNGM